ncbi:unnamed protein product [Laminaria digitata]
MPVSSGTTVTAGEKKPRNSLNEKQRQRLIEHLLSGSTKGKLAKGDLLQPAAEFSCSRHQVKGVWNRYQQQKADGVDIDLRNRRFGNSGRKGIDTEKLNEALKEVPLENRTSQRAVAKQLGISQQVLQKNLKKLSLRATSRFLQPAAKRRGMRFTG